jgi:hypothetical protein
MGKIPLFEGGEQCWKIQEQRPIKVTVKPNMWGGFNIEVPAMSMTFDTFRTLGDNLDKEQAAYGDRNREKPYEHPNAVRNSSYTYSDGQCYFYAPTEEDITAWLTKYADIVTKGDPVKEDMIIGADGEVRDAVNCKISLLFNLSYNGNFTEQLGTKKHRPCLSGLVMAQAKSLQADGWKKDVVKYEEPGVERGATGASFEWIIKEALEAMKFLPDAYRIAESLRDIFTERSVSGMGSAELCRMITFDTNGYEASNVVYDLDEDGKDAGYASNKLRQMMTMQDEVYTEIASAFDDESYEGDDNGDEDDDLDDIDPDDNVDDVEEYLQKADAYIDYLHLSKGDKLVLTNDSTVTVKSWGDGYITLNEQPKPIFADTIISVNGHKVPDFGTFDPDDI